MKSIVSNIPKRKLKKNKIKRMNENAESRKAEGENLLREACCEERDCLVACSERMKDNL